MECKWTIGIDEAGRGPLAGPVAVGLVLVPANFDWGLVPGVGDSKKVSEKKREEIYHLTKNLEKSAQLACVVEMVSAAKIDKEGISVCIKKAIASGLKKLRRRQDLALISGQAISHSSSARSCLELDVREVMVKLDGSLRAPAEYAHQETIIKGDAKEKVIGLASIMAKVTRDRYMRRVAQRPAYAPYDFARHKGYGTSAHRQAIAQNGLSTEHRRSYCKNIKVVV